ncbi:hypothetical protein CPB83DRAFT_900935 [Crepidotus variabilis]|nr:hypothetical protein CPB83DRAFT_900935 [Crepidotus variabilis]
MKIKIRAGQAAGGAHAHNYGPGDPLGDFSVPCPPDPGLTERELLMLHAEVLALQQQLGISYKDAAHRLYLGEAKVAMAEANAASSTKNLRNDFMAGVQHYTRNSVEPSAEEDQDRIAVD